MSDRRRHLHTAVAIVLLHTAGLVAHSARAQSNEELRAIVHTQQRQIDELSHKIDTLTRESQAAKETAEAAVETAHKAEDEGPDIKVKWAPGPTFSSKDDSWSLHVLGRLLVDGGGLGDQDGLYKNDNAIEVRSARIGVEGHFYEGWKYKFEADFANSDVDLKDNYIEYSGELLKPAYVRVGQFKTFNSLEWMTNRLFITFMERAAIVDAFGITRQLGLATGTSGANWGVDVGLFGQNASDQNNNEGYALAGRGHYAFFYGPKEDGNLIHLGASARYRNFDNGTFNTTIQYRQRPFFHFTSTQSVNTAKIVDAEGDIWSGLEFAWVNGSFSLQSEAANTFLRRKNGEDNANLWGGYLSASYFLTGEHRPYDPKGGVFDRIKVKRPLQNHGPGAWELAARADYLDLNDADIRGGKQIGYIAGVNWYANDYVRFMLDGAITQVFDAENSDAAVKGSSNLIYGFGIRAQVDW